MKILQCRAHSGAVMHYRFELPRRELEDVGCVVRVLGEKDGNWLYEVARDHGDTFVDYLMDIARQSDVIHASWVTALEGIEGLVAMREQAKIPLIIEFDDDIINVPSYNIGFNAYHKGAPERKIAHLCLKVADAISVTTEPLKELYAQHTDVPIHVLPNCMDTYPAVKPVRPADDAVYIMFAAGAGRKGDIDLIRRPIEHVMAKYDHVRLLFMGLMPDWAAQWAQDKRKAENNRAFFVMPSNVELYKRVIKYLHPDIFLGPVLPNEFNRSKSWIKAYDAAGMGAAFICSDYDTYAPVPEDACVKCTDDADWIEGLEILIEDPASRKYATKNLTKWARANTIDKHIQKWLNLYQDVLRLKDKPHALQPRSASSEINITG